MALPNGIVIVNTTDETIQINSLKAQYGGYHISISGSNGSIGEQISGNTTYDLRANRISHWLQPVSNQEEVATSSPRALKNIENFV